VPYPDQRRVRAALQRGGKVDDPALAPIAVAAAERRLRGDDAPAAARYRTAIGVAQTLLGAFALAAGIGEGDAIQIVFGGFLLLVAVVGFAGQRIERGRLHRAAAANRALAGEPRYPADET